MKRKSCRFPGVFLAGLMIWGADLLCRVDSIAAAEEGPQPSLSGVLAVPAGERQESPLKDPFRSPISPRDERVERQKTPELPPLQLTAILMGPGRTAAVVNGTILRPGDTYLDMKVLDITKNQVLLQRGVGKVTLIQGGLYNPLSRGGK